MQAIWPLGNDIVDLRLAENKNSAANPRFVQRVLATEERPVGASTIDDRLVWAYWAAKETAYKALKKTTPELSFSHRQFIVHPETANAFVADHGTAQGKVVHQQSCVPLSWAWTDDWIHCVSNNTEPSQYRIDEVSRWMQHNAFSELKKTSQLSDASVAVRMLALSLLEDNGFEDVQIQREPAGRRQGPPLVVRDGIILRNIELSLSHDGRYVAAAIQINDAPNDANDVS